MLILPFLFVFFPFYFYWISWLNLSPTTEGTRTTLCKVGKLMPITANSLFLTNHFKSMASNVNDNNIIIHSLLYSASLLSFYFDTHREKKLPYDLTQLNPN